MRKLGLTVSAVLLLSALFMLSPSQTGAIESSITLVRRHASCDSQIWQHLEESARERADVFCASRGGVVESSLRYVHDGSDHGGEQICVLHLHFECVGELPGDG